VPTRRPSGKSAAVSPSTGAELATIEDSLRRVLIPLAKATELELRGATAAAVLVPLHVNASNELCAVFTRRREDMRRHAGEISFPGGRRDPKDKDLLTTAIREANEEVGLEPTAVTPLGALQPTPTIATGYAIHPYVALIEPPPDRTLSEREVAEVIDLPLAHVKQGYSRQRLLRRGMPIRTDTYVVGRHLIWGATARVLSDLFDRLPPELLAS
jgi:8-oxo-dGTP pyrophosphatase MutT (NUDIX family)